MSKLGKETNNQGAGPDPDSLKVLFRLASLPNRLSPAISPFTLRQFELLYLIAAQPGIQGSTLAGYQNVKFPTVSQSLERLVKGGYLERKRDKEDARKVRYFCTEESLMDLYEARRKLINIRKQYLSVLSSNEQELLLNLLVKVLQAN